VVHSWDNHEVGVAHEVKSPKHQPQFSQTMMGQYWFGKTKLSDDPKCFQKVATEFYYLTEFLTD